MYRPLLCRLMYHCVLSYKAAQGQVYHGKKLNTVSNVFFFSLVLSLETFLTQNKFWVEQQQYDIFFLNSR